jgi:hypothetical protein
MCVPSGVGEAAAEALDFESSFFGAAFGFAANALNMLELSFLSAGGFAPPFFAGSVVFVSDFVLVVLLNAGFATASGVGAFAGALVTGFTVAVTTAGTAAGAGGRWPPVRRYEIVSKISQTLHTRS